MNKKNIPILSCITGRKGGNSCGSMFNFKYLLLAATIALFIIMFGIGSVSFRGFFSLKVFFDLFIDNPFLFIAAIGMTFVIITGGIDLSVGSVAALTTMITGTLVEIHGVSPAVVLPFVLLVGSLIGFLIGIMVHFFKIQPFIATLGGMFLARGIALMINTDSITLNNSFFRAVSNYHIPVIGNAFITINVVIILMVVIAAVILAHYTNFGRTVYAIGGNEQSAILMGLPVGRTKILVYTISGFCSALAGVTMMFYMPSGNPLHGVGMEMDVIAAVVIGGTMLTGGSGYMLGTVFGVLILGTIATLINFQGGSVNPWWIRIINAALILVFCLLQILFEKKGRKIAKS